MLWMYLMTPIDDTHFEPMSFALYSVSIYVSGWFQTKLEGSQKTEDVSPPTE